MISDFDKGFVKWIEDNIMSLTPYQIALLLSFTCNDEETETKMREIIEKSNNGEYGYRCEIPLKYLNGDMND